MLAAAGAEPRGARAPSCWRDGYPAYTTSAGWLGYDDDKIRRLCREALAEGWTPVQDEGRGRPRGRHPPRARSCARRSAATAMLMVDANQVWDVGQAIDWMAQPRGVRPVLDRGADEPRRHPRPRRDRARRGADPGRDRRARPQPRHVQAVAPGRGAIDFCQIDACRLGGVNEVLAVLLMAAEVRRAGLPARRRGRACASSCSTWRSSTTSRSAASLDGPR